MFALKTFKTLVVVIPLLIVLTYAYAWHKEQIQIAKASVEQIYTHKYVRDLESRLDISSALSVTQARLNKEHEQNIRHINSQLDDALSRLSKRPNRVETVVTLPSDASAPCINTGAGLSREDAEFLTREAAVAAKLYNDYQHLHKLYTEVYETTKKTYE